jgi:hypothetical protein
MLFSFYYLDWGKEMGDVASQQRDGNCLGLER